MNGSITVAIGPTTSAGSSGRLHLLDPQVAQQPVERLAVGVVVLPESEGRPFALAPEPVCPPGSGACSTAGGSARSPWSPACQPPALTLRLEQTPLTRKPGRRP